MVDIVSKTQLMQHIAAGRGHECFEHSEEGWFDVTLMREWAQKHIEPVEVNLKQIVPFARESRVWEEQRVNDIPFSDAVRDPALVVEYTRPEGTTHLYIDGTHRAIKLERAGVPTQLVYIIPEANIIRPDMTRMGKTVDVHGVDWGDDFKDGKIVKREQKPHRWDADGERCLDCGDKDWMAGPYCAGKKT